MQFLESGPVGGHNVGNVSGSNATVGEIDPPHLGTVGFGQKEVGAGGRDVHLFQVDALNREAGGLAHVVGMNGGILGGDDCC